MVGDNDGCSGLARATDSIKNAGLRERKEGTIGQPAAVRQLQRKPRHTLFTPMKVAGGPANAADVGSTRVPVGEYAGGGSFCEVEKWKEVKELHRRLKGPWVGCTYSLKKC